MTKWDCVHLALLVGLVLPALQWGFHWFLDRRNGVDWKRTMGTAAPGERLAYFGQRWQGTSLIVFGIAIMLGLILAA